jgi:peptidyl-prolyl cis-trans isomerase B (cyclophilin B)
MQTNHPWASRPDEPGNPFANLFALPILRASMNDIRIIIHTSRGDIEGTLFASKVPMTAANFLNLAQRGFYNGVKFHRLGRARLQVRR